MKKTILILTLLCTTLFANREIIIFDKEIYENYLNWENVKKEERRKIGFSFSEEGPFATNCIEYLKYIKDYRPATTIDHQTQAEYFDCEVINYIGNTKVTYQKKSDINYAKYIYKYLNVMSLGGTLSMGLNKPFVTLTSIFKKGAKVNIKNNLVLDIVKLDPKMNKEPYWSYYFEIIGVERKDNKNYLLVYFLDDAVEATYFAVQFLVFDYQNNRIQFEEQPLYKEPNENSKTNMYLIKNDVVEILEEKENWIYILYITKDNKEIKAWIPKNALEFRSSNE